MPSAYGGRDRSIHSTREADTAVVEVLDDGGGSPIEHRERIFEPYARAHERPGLAASVGLGLTVSQQLAELMGETIVYSREDGYSVFRLSLPLTKQPVA